MSFESNSNSLWLSLVLKDLPKDRENIYFFKKKIRIKLILSCSCVGAMVPFINLSYVGL